MPENVRTYHRGSKPGVQQDNHRIAAARVQLKLAALAYNECRHGADAGPGFARDGLAFLCQMAIRYVEALKNEDLSGLHDHTLGLSDGM